MPKLPSLSGRHAVITGGSSGIGLAVADELRAQGARVSLLARGPERLDAAAAHLRSKYPTGGQKGPAAESVATFAVDVADEPALRQAIEAAVTELGPCDVLVASAGLTYPGYFGGLPLDTFRSLMEVNYFGLLHAIRAVAPSMVERRQGSIVGVSSAAGLIGVFGYSAYGPTKYAARGLLESLRAEMAPHGVHVGCVFPPDTDTAQLAFEEPLKPVETKAISGSIKPISAERVARATVAGIEAGRFWITADTQTRLLARLGGLGREALAWDFDRRAAKAARRTRDVPPGGSRGADGGT
jgi:3-dehydrosphinganine reductase